MRKRTLKRAPKEKRWMATSLVLAVSACTLAGIYGMQTRNHANEEYLIDFSKLEGERQNELGANAESDAAYYTQTVGDSVLPPTSAEISDESGYNITLPQNAENAPIEKGNPKKENTGNTNTKQTNAKKTNAENANTQKVNDKKTNTENANTQKANDKKTNTDNANTQKNNDNKTNAENTSKDTENANTETEPTQKANTENTSTEKPQTGQAQQLIWPVSGDIALGYSMDKVVFFKTLQQYKYNPATIILAKEGDAVKAPANATVTALGNRAEIGAYIELDLGDGYTVILGQLKDLTVKENAAITQGEVIGAVAKTSKYYSVEGDNVYFEVRKNQTAVNPMGILE